MIEKLYRPNVGLMVINSDGDVFMAHRTDERKQAWQMPQGGIDKHEDPYKAALRELEEETGITKVTLMAESKNWYSYDFPDGVTFTSKKKKCFIGQMQKWFLFMFEGDEGEINLNQHDIEFDDWQWMSVEEVIPTIVDFKRDVYTKVVEEFLPFIEAVKSSSEKS